MTKPAPTSTVITDSSPAEPVGLELMRNHCRVVADDEDKLLQHYQLAARKMVEQSTGLSLIRVTARHRLRCWPAGRTIELPLRPLVSVESITYLDPDGESVEWAGEWWADSDHSPGLIWLTPAAAWPGVINDRGDAITITYTAGHDPSSLPAPEQAVQAILLLVGHWYRNRESVVVGTINSDLQMGYDRLINSITPARYP